MFELDTIFGDLLQGPVDGRQPLFFDDPGNGQQFERRTCYYPGSVTFEEIQVDAVIDTVYFGAFTALKFFQIEFVLPGTGCHEHRQVKFLS